MAHDGGEPEKDHQVVDCGTLEFLGGKAAFQKHGGHAERRHHVHHGKALDGRDELLGPQVYIYYVYYCEKETQQSPRSRTGNGGFNNPGPGPRARRAGRPIAPAHGVMLQGPGTGLTGRKMRGKACTEASPGPECMPRSALLSIIEPNTVLSRHLTIY